MKKIIALILSFLMLVPTVYADTTASGELEKVLVAVKSKVDISTELSIFESNISKYGEQIYYNFDWHSPAYDKSVSVSADEEGHIRSYYVYTQKMAQKKLSGVSKNEIISFAEEFIKKAIPEMYQDPTDVLIFDDKSYSAGSFLRYSLTYKRYKNGVYVKDNFVNITVGITEEDVLYISNMSANIDYKTPFAQAGGEIADYTSRYKEAFPTELVYQNEYNPDWKEKGERRTKGALIYRIKDNEAGFISLETGEIVTESKSEDEIFRDESAESMGSPSNKNDSLTPEELEEITAVEGLLSVGDIEAKIKSLPYIKFPDGVKLNSSNLIKNDDGKYVYNLNYVNEEEKAYSYLHISAYAEDGKLISLNQSAKENRKDIEALTPQQKGVAEKKIEQFLTASTAEFPQTVLEKCEDNNGFVNSYYYREINGLKHINEGINVTYDAENAIITEFSLHFTNTEFESPEKAIDKETAYGKITEYSPIIKMYVKTGESYTLCATLEKKDVILDAFTGAVKNAENDQNQAFSYDDIKGHWAEEAANKLAEIQIGLEGEKLNPEGHIIQEELLRFLASGIYGKYYHTYNTEDLYENLIREKVIGEEEKNPSAGVKREEAFVYLIRMAGLERVAKLQNIYKVDFADSNLLSDGKIGYCAILGGMGVICGDGGYLRPQDNLSRAEAVIMLYRYLLTL